MKALERHPIKVVSRRTGLSAHVIRIWEKRYDAVTPERTETNRRLYTDDDIKRLTLLRRATEAGRSIGQVAHIPTEELRQIVEEDEAAILHAPEQKNGSTHHIEDESSPTELLESALHAVQELNGEELEKILNRAAVDLGQRNLLEHLVVPLLHELGDRWRDGRCRVTHEHLASSIIRSFLSGLRSGLNSSSSGPSIIITTPAGQFHEIGALIAALISSSEGWRATYLGPNLPAEEIAAAAKQNKAKAIALSLVYPTDDSRVDQELKKIRKYVGPEIDILAGGRAVPDYMKTLEEIDAIVTQRIGDLYHKLEIMRRRNR